MNSMQKIKVGSSGRHVTVIISGRLMSMILDQNKSKERLFFVKILVFKVKILGFGFSGQIFPVFKKRNCQNFGF